MAKCQIKACDISLSMDHSWATGLDAEVSKEVGQDCWSHHYSFAHLDFANITTAESVMTPILTCAFCRFQRMHWQTHCAVKHCCTEAAALAYRPKGLLGLWTWAAQNFLLGFLWGLKEWIFISQLGNAWHSICKVSGFVEMNIFKKLV